MNNTTNYRELRQQKHDQMEALITKAQAEKRNLNAAEAESFDQLERECRQLERSAKTVEGYNARGGQVVKRERTAADNDFLRYLRTGEKRTTLSGLNETGFLDSGTDGGYTVPEGFWDALTVAQKAYGGMSNDFQRVETPTGNPMDWATIDPTAVSASIVGDDLTVLDVTSPYTFGQGVLNAWTVAIGPVLASLQLIEDSAFQIDDFIAARFGEALGRKIAAYSASGTGSGQPLGIYPSITAKGAASGASGGYVALSAGATVQTFAASDPTELAGNTLRPDSLLKLVKSVDPAYFGIDGGCKWYMNASQAWNLRSVVDDNGRPLINFENGFDADSVTGADYNSNAPVAKLFGFPVIIDNNVTDLTASTVSGPIFGNLHHAMVMRVVRSGVRVMRLDQRWADALAVGYLGYYRYDSRSNDLRAVAVCKPDAT